MSVPAVPNPSPVAKPGPVAAISLVILRAPNGREYRTYPPGTPLADIPPRFRGAPYEEYTTAALLAQWERDREAWIAQHGIDSNRIPFGNARTNYGIRGHVSPRANGMLPTERLL